MNPLYCYKYQEETGRVEVVEIDEYEEGVQLSNKEYYRFKLHGAFRYGYKHQIDRYMNNRIYSFDPDLKHALDIMKEYARSKLAKAHVDVTTYEFMLDDLTKDRNRKHEIKKLK